jgi:SPP1 family holin
MKRTVETTTIVRTICLVLALVNQLLSSTGHAVLPIADEQVETLVTVGATVVIAVWNWWKNNSFTQAALAGDELKNSLKGGK